MFDNEIPVIESAGIKAKIISPDDGYYFFGYYDLQPFDSTGRYHLCHKPPFQDRIPGADDVCEVGVIDLQEGKFIKYGETTAWNFQQGAMLQWYRDDDHIVFNIFEDNAYKCCVVNIKTGEKRVLPLPIATVSADGKWGLSINFSRIFDFRAGYGYAALKDPYADINAPEEDGLFLLNMITGEYKLLVSYAQMRDKFAYGQYVDAKLLINHVTFNPSGTRYIMLLRNFIKQTIRTTMLLSGDLDGNLCQLSEFRYQSHYHWKNDTELLIYGGVVPKTEEDGLFLYTDLSDKFEKLPKPNPEDDLHCLYSPNRRYIMGDGYPDNDGYCDLHLIDTVECTDTLIAKYRSATVEWATHEYRCDRHARFDRTGRYVSFDSNHTGDRTICLLDMRDLPGYEW